MRCGRARRAVDETVILPFAAALLLRRRLPSPFAPPFTAALLLLPGLMTAQAEGLTRAIGVSNFKTKVRVGVSFCHSAAPPSAFSWCFKSDGGRASAKWQNSRQRRRHQDLEALEGATPAVNQWCVKGRGGRAGSGGSRVGQQEEDSKARAEVRGEGR